MTGAAAVGTAPAATATAGAAPAAVTGVPPVAHDAFTRRHIGTDAAAQQTMLAALGYDSVEALVKTAVPASVQVAPRTTSDIPAAATEREAIAELRAGHTEVPA